MRLILVDKKTGKEITDGDKIMEYSGLDPLYKYEDFGMQSDGQLVAFDRCGNFGYLDHGLVMVCLGL